MSKTNQPVIPVHRMDVQTPFGMQFDYYETDSEYAENTKPEKYLAHRDDYYLFLFMDTEETVFTIDFEDIQVQGERIFYVRPGQVHFTPVMRNMKGWFLAIDPALVDNNCRKLFEKQFTTQKPVVLDASISVKLTQTAHLLHTITREKPTAFSEWITLNVANAFIGIIAEQYSVQQEKLPYSQSRSLLIAHQFQALLLDNVRTLKSPIQYAEALNYSLSHLNESVKITTGFPISYWIHQQVILEAKRLLYYTDMNVKEIAFSLGYEDHTYFSRLFSKVTGCLQRLLDRNSTNSPIYSPFMLFPEESHLCNFAGVTESLLWM